MGLSCHDSKQKRPLLTNQNIIQASCYGSLIPLEHLIGLISTPHSTRISTTLSCLLCMAGFGHQGKRFLQQQVHPSCPQIGTCRAHRILFCHIVLRSRQDTPQRTQGLFYCELQELREQMKYTTSHTRSATTCLDVVRIIAEDKAGFEAYDKEGPCQGATRCGNEKELSHFCVTSHF